MKITNFDEKHFPRLYTDILGKKLRFGRLFKLTYDSSISEFQNSIYDDSYIVQPEPRIAAGAWQQAGALCPIYESSYIKFCNSEIELVYTYLYISYTYKVSTIKSIHMYM